MNTFEIEKLLQDVSGHDISVEEALKRLKKISFEDLKFAVVDHNRELRQGIPEVIYGEGKTAEQIKDIFIALKNNSSANIMATRVNIEKYKLIHEYIPETQYDELARVAYIKRIDNDSVKKGILVITAGTSDMYVAKETVITASMLGYEVDTLYDVGVAGIHRLLVHIDKISEARVIIAIAGMDGALASVVGGIASCPVIAVPTSVGYGTAFSGMASLLSMLNSCAAGLAVVNIDNGFGASVLAHRIISVNQ